MKFQFGDKISNDLRSALQHEYYRCEDAFNSFALASSLLIHNEKDKTLAYAVYNSYSSFIHHLYEFYVGAIKNDNKDTQNIHYDFVDKAITKEVQKILDRKRESIIKGYAPIFENDLSAYPETAPSEFAEKFRHIRNYCHAHVSHKRTQLSLTDFFSEYHQYAYLLYSEPYWLWGSKNREFPDLKEITDFSIQIRKSK